MYDGWNHGNNITGNHYQNFVSDIAPPCIRTLSQECLFVIYVSQNVSKYRKIHVHVYIIWKCTFLRYTVRVSFPSDPRAAGFRLCVPSTVRFGVPLQLGLPDQFKAYNELVGISETENTKRIPPSKRYHWICSKKVNCTLFSMIHNDIFSQYIDQFLRFLHFW